MLAKGAPPRPPPKTHRQSLQVINNSLHFHSSLVCFNPRSSKRLSVFLLRASHPHTTITAAATSSTIGDYSQLDDDPLIPATNDSYTNIQAIEGIVSVGNSGPPTPRTRGLAGNFDKLKAQKLKALAKRASLIKKSVRNCVDDPTKEAKTSISDLQFGTPERKVVHTPVKHKKEISYVSENDDFRGSGSDASAPRHSAAHSRGWGDGGSVYRFRPNPKSTDHFEGRNKFSAESEFFSRKSFRDVGCSEFMIESLKGQLFLQPSHIQAMAFTPVLDGKTCVIADQSGSGKTLAYLIPIIQRLRLEELQGLGETIPRSPRVLIMVPTAELATQVLNICRSLSKYGIPFRSMVVTGGHRQKTQLENLEQGVDVLIATPGRFMFLIREGFMELTNLRCAVLDEVDILCNDEDFEAALQNLINSSPVNMQYLFVTATLPLDVYNKLIEIFPDCKMIMGPGIHRTSTGLEEVLVDCSGEYGTEKSPDTAFLNKKSALLQLVEQRPVRKTIIFCNKIETCRKVENVLKRFDRKGSRVRVFPFHAALEQESRLANMKEFMNPQSEKGSLFLVCTDRASRGIDFAGVDHVVLFDFPRDPSEYVRRVGRTARGAGGKGKAFIFVVGKQVSLARRIIERNQKGHPLHEVPSAYELMT